MKSLMVIDLLDEIRKLGYHVLESLILTSVHLLVLQRLDETLPRGILMGIDSSRYSDQEAVVFKFLHMFILVHCTP
jgi:hypothetical protein